MSGLAVAGLTVHYGETTAVHDMSLHVPQGDVLALVGASGCGKSTLLRAVAGLVLPTAGAISWDGADITATPTHRRDVGLMFQHHALFSHRSVHDNIAFGLKMTGVRATEQDRRVAELLALVGLEGFGERSVEALSGGEAQRVALARALAPEPAVLLLDEPLASLDRARRVELNAELARLLRELNQTSIYVTHDQDEAFAVADQIGVMDNGELLRTGTPTEVWRDPQSEVVSRFMGHETIIERNGTRYAVRADALRLATEGDGVVDVVGNVAACAFQGDRHELLVRDSDNVSWRLFTTDPVAVGSVAHLILDPTKLAPLL